MAMYSGPRRGSGVAKPGADASADIRGTIARTLSRARAQIDQYRARPDNLAGSRGEGGPTSLSIRQVEVVLGVGFEGVVVGGIGADVDGADGREKLHDAQEATAAEV